MKSIFKLLGIIALVAAIGFSFTACGDSSSGDNGGNGNGGNGGGGDGEKISVTFTALLADGFAQYITTTQLTLQFSQAINGLSASDISLNGVSGITKGTLTGSNPYTLPISGFSESGTLSVAVSKTDYTVTGSPKTVQVYYLEPPPTNGSNSEYDYQEYINRIIITNYKGSASSLTIPSQIDWKPVTTIGSNTFKGLRSLTNIIIPNTVTSIEYCAFEECINLVNVTIPDSVTSINFYAFKNCSSLANVTLPNSVTSIGSGAFQKCSSLVSVIIPNGVTSIEMYTFNGCTSLTSVTIPNTVTSIEYGSFGSCTSLASVTIPNSVTSIGYASFSGCTSLASVTIPNSVISIDSWAFCDCSSLANVTFPNSVTSIGYNAFDGCSSLIKITIPNSVASIGKEAFKNCNKLSSVTFESTIPSSNFGNNAFDGDLLSKFYADNARNGTPGTYTTSNPGLSYKTIWTRQ
jgi:hypothetical protein